MVTDTKAKAAASTAAAMSTTKQPVSKATSDIGGASEDHAAAEEAIAAVVDEVVASSNSMPNGDEQEMVAETASTDSETSAKHADAVRDAFPEVFSPAPPTRRRIARKSTIPHNQALRPEQPRAAAARASPRTSPRKVTARRVNRSSSKDPKKVPAAKVAQTVGTAKTMQSKASTRAPVTSPRTGRTAATKDKTPNKARKSSGGNKSGVTVEIYRGPPDEEMQGGWPEGWVKVVEERRSSTIATKGRRDRYWYTPAIGFKLRSMANVHRFVSHLKTTKGDETKAYALLTTK